jgi:hypothetical protein
MRKDFMGKGVRCVAWVSAQLQSVETPDVVFVLIDDLSHYGVTAYGVAFICEYNR